MRILMLVAVLTMLTTSCKSKPEAVEAHTFDSDCRKIGTATCEWADRCFPKRDALVATIYGADRAACDAIWSQRCQGAHFCGATSSGPSSPAIDVPAAQIGQCVTDLRADRCTAKPSTACPGVCKSVR